MIDQIILGDNQFFGVNHMSQDRGRETFEQFKDITEIRRILEYSLDKGVHGVMLSTHPAVNDICNMVRADERLRTELRFYVNVPYIIKYVSMVTEMGVYHTICHVLSTKNGVDKIPFLAKALWNGLTFNYMGIFEQLIEIELAPFHGLNVNAVFLHNSLCDLALAYRLGDILKKFDSHIRDHYHAIPAYGTLNCKRFLDYLTEIGLDGSLVMTGFNKLGFLMNPSQRACEETAQNTHHTILAMATLASGRLKPEEAYAYLAQEGIHHVVVGLSSKTHADETFSYIQKYILNS